MDAAQGTLVSQAGLVVGLLAGSQALSSSCGGALLAHGVRDSPDLGPSLTPISALRIPYHGATRRCSKMVCNLSICSFILPTHLCLSFPATHLYSPTHSFSIHHLSSLHLFIHSTLPHLLTAPVQVHSAISLSGPLHPPTWHPLNSLPPPSPPFLTLARHEAV